MQCAKNDFLARCHRRVAARRRRGRWKKVGGAERKKRDDKRPREGRMTEDERREERNFSEGEGEKAGKEKACATRPRGRKESIS